MPDARAGAWAAASAVAAASARMVGGCRMVAVIKSPFVVKVFFVVAGPGAASTGSGSWSNWLLRLPPAPARSRRTPLLAEDPRVASAQAGVVDPPRPCRLPISRRHPPLRWSWSSNLPFAIRGFRHRAGVVAAAASDTRGGRRKRARSITTLPSLLAAGWCSPRIRAATARAGVADRVLVVVALMRRCRAAARRSRSGSARAGRSAPRTPSGPTGGGGGRR